MGSTGPETIDCDVLIVGAGIFGTSTAYHLSLTHPDPSRIVVLDRAPFPSPEAASSDMNKIVRADYSSAFYMDLAFEAMDAWSSWDFLKPYYHRTGWVALDEKTSDLSERIRVNFRNSGRPDPSQDITLEEVKTRWDGVLSGINTSDYSKAYTNLTAGWCDASLVVEAMMKQAIQRGVRYEVGEVDGLIGGERSLFGVRTTDGRMFCGRKIVLATGGWTPWLMAPLEQSLEIGEDDSVDRQISTAGVCVAAFTLTDEKEIEHYSKMPVLIYGSQVSLNL
jgi:sarcosine oxidase/L-pipecolate oxidase